MTALSRIFLAAQVALLAVTSFAQSAATCRPATQYKVVAVPLHPARINNSGVVVGTTEEEQAARWTRNAALRELAVPAGFSGFQTLGLNDRGDIVGQVTVDAVHKTQAFAYVQGKFRLLSEAQSKAKAINQAGQIAGEESPGGPVVWQVNKRQMLGGCCGGRVFAINDQGQVAGEINDREGHYNAFVWDARKGLESIITPGARSSTALAINNSGHLLIQTFSPNQIFLRENGQRTLVELSPDFASQPLALNDCDVIVGEYGASSDYYHAFVWDRKNGFRDLNTLIDQSEGWKLEQAVDINSRGEIVGTGDHQNESDVGFLLIPDGKPEITKETK